MRQPETRPSLIAHIKGQRNEFAWTEFVLAYEPFLLRLVERQGVPQRHVPDVVQQVFLGIAKSIDGWQDDGREASFRRWLHRVARNVVIKFMSRERQQIGGAGGTDFLELIEHTPDRHDEGKVREYEHELMVWAAEQVRNEFRESSWKAFWLTQVEGYSVTEVSSILRLKPGAIYMSRSRVMSRIQAKVREIQSD